MPHTPQAAPGRSDKVHELYFNRQNYVDAMSKSHQMDAVKTIMELINAAAEKKTN